jgi:hypothetical protein
MLDIYCRFSIPFSALVTVARVGVIVVSTAGPSPDDAIGMDLVSDLLNPPCSLLYKQLCIIHFGTLIRFYAS